MNSIFRRILRYITRQVFTVYRFIDAALTGIFYIIPSYLKSKFLPHVAAESWYAAKGYALLNVNIFSLTVDNDANDFFMPTGKENLYKE